MNNSKLWTPMEDYSLTHRDVDAIKRLISKENRYIPQQTKDVLTDYLVYVLGVNRKELAS